MCVTTNRKAVNRSALQSGRLVGIMVIKCAVTCCKNKRYKWASKSFHQFPVRDPEGTQLWLLAAGLDLNQPAD